MARTSALTIFALLTFATTAHAGNCPADPGDPGATKTIDGTGTHIQRSLSLSDPSKGCQLSISQDAGNGIASTPSHSYMISQQGIFIAQVGFADGYAGAEDYFIFPRGKAVPAVAQTPTGMLSVTLPTGDSITMDPGSQAPCEKACKVVSPAPKILDSPDATLHVTESGKVIEGTKAAPTTGSAGVEIHPASGSHTLVLDTGFAMNGISYRFATRSSTFHDGSGNSCKFVNTDLFTYKPGSYDPAFKFKTDADLAGFLKSHCPKIDVSGLLSGTNCPTCSGR